MAFKELDLAGNKPANTGDIRNKMQKGNFKIGDEKNRKMGNDTIYSLGISAEKGAMGLNRNIDDRKHLHGSINLGTN